MADRSLKDGSDADYEFTCTPCSKDNIREEADKYCPECQEYLCKTCIRYHSRLKASQQHKLLDKRDAKQGVVVSRIKCLFHPDREIEMYCLTHDMVYCLLCIATEHRSCDGVNTIEDVSKQCVTQAEIQSLLDGTQTVQDKVKSLTVKQKQNVTAIEKEKEAIEGKLDDTVTKLMEHIRTLKRETAKCLNDKYSTLKEELVSAISVSGRTAEDLKQTKEQLHTIDSLDLEQQFVRMKLVKKTVQDANTFITEGEAEGTKFIDFTVNKELTDIITKANSIGEVTTGIVDEQELKQRQYTIKSTKEINVKLSNDKWVCCISDICILPDDTILLTDHYNNKVKRLDSNDSVENVYDFHARTTGICSVSNSEVAVKLNNNRIQLFSVGSPLSKGKTIDIKNGGQFGLTMCCGDLWSSASNCVNVYSTSSYLLKSIVKDQNGKSIFKSNVQHMSVTSDTVIVTDSSDGAVCLNKDGVVIRELRDSRLKNTRGVCKDDDGTVFLCGYQSQNIVMFNRDGKCLGELIGKDSGLKLPVSMFFDGRRNRLIVGCGDRSILFVIEFDC
ncbi:E3 ubiquitin-protein ligase Midline-1-like [Ruditapes philippinarum]|uniref:E3 ubiquitin-protein ligase Midline-1-like n=1 Tax=Ruditapes philippinarum TaxID=129788 RepID=UPI00295AF7EA|nr:E3 ubiquitin-protein ligase Midline-1-like [Ruditapes philippinarum]